MNSQASEVVSERDYRDVCEFLFGEADLLDARDYAGWLGQLSAHVTYRVFAHVLRDAAAEPQTYDIFDETAATLERRILQLENPRLTHAENPPSMTRRFVSNIRVRRGEDLETFAVTSNILVHRSRGSLAAPWQYAGRRSDILERRERIYLAKREVALDHSVIDSWNISTFF